MPRGGKRVGAGRPKGSGKHGETTVPMRVPISMIDEISDLIEKRKAHNRSIYIQIVYSHMLRNGAPEEAISKRLSQLQDTQ